MAANPQIQKSEMVTFTCARHRDLKMVYKRSEQLAVYQDGKQVIHETPEVYIQFRNGIYQTDDPGKIQFITSHSLFTGQQLSGLPDRQCIFLGPKVDPEAIKLQHLLQRHGVAGIVRSIEQQYNLQQGNTIQDPVAASVAQQGQPTNAPVYVNPGR